MMEPIRVYSAYDIHMGHKYERLGYGQLKHCEIIMLMAMSVNDNSLWGASA